MSGDRLEQLAKAAGIAIEWTAYDGQRQRVSPEALRNLLKAIELPADSDADIEASLRKLAEVGDKDHLPPLITALVGKPVGTPDQFKSGVRYQVQLEGGERLEGTVDARGQLPAIEQPGYHQAEIDGRPLTLAVAPERCYTIADATGDEHARLWGLAVQLYSLRREGGSGAGDLQGLVQLAKAAASKGADALAISPLHAMFSADGSRYSPYSPSSRVFFNVLYAAPELVFGADRVHQAMERAGLQAEAERLEQLELIDWPALAKLRLRLLRTLHLDFRTADGELRQRFETFRREGGEALENHCRFEALHASFTQGEASPSWQHWPPQYRDPKNPAVAEFAEHHAQDVEFYAFTQWLASEGLAAAQRQCRDAGMHIGLIADIAVGADGGGSQAWSRQEELLASVTVGCPPDLLNQKGQGWGISAFSPTGMVKHGFRAFIEMLRANFAHAGGVRIDHVMGLQRLWLVPEGASPADGAYLSYPIDDLLRLVALESWRYRCVVMGEDLGTVPEGFRERLAERAVMGMQILLFERDGKAFKAAKAWSATAMGMPTTHDLPTLTGWWQGRDADWQEKLGLLPDGTSREDQLAERAEDRRHLAKVLHLEDTSVDNVEAAVDAAIDFIGRTPAPLIILPVEDALGQLEQANLPGTTNEHPNWLRRWDAPADRLLDAATPERRLSVLSAARNNPEITR
ncbi:4-alpha-glucanotransferase [Pseudomonas rhizoryzae]|uniref:4-alpha-glucanotransferase n=1 Tax=Pseudomonas rhizoryzae TaxID=2571129 RepID=UPI000736A353|nr:4-alpha-glucanotransferase [Pseudomonas rhizoryzae]KTT37770.1 4-alpha-glucanotransferase [Pseudomonas psychrotolerans]KTT76433.1 4-alpha-glucanotransferase [Pseudomonas psychrotolerans]